ncbi:MAG: alpha/beta fold hydrolase, partial [Flavisolibacter sp.]|nr:alpha/beta fold hydrolase [Flavisolibacter sp.]
MRHKCFRLAAFVGIVMFPLCNALQAQSDSAGKIVFESYTFRTYDGKQYDAELGKLWVRENRNIRSSPLIQLSFVRLKSFSTAPGAPIIFLAGGPGVPSIAMAKVPVYFSLFQKLQEVADVIFLDQRGCGLSVPNLECSNELRTANMFENEKNWLNSLERMSKNCADYWRSKGVDLAAYTSEASADDLEDLRRALHVSKISLIGHSYGTYLAQVAIRNHEDTIEKIVLANTDGTGDFLASPAVWDILIKKLSYYAKADSSINKIIPDFEQMYRNVLSTLEKKPVVVNVMDYEKKKSVELKVGKIGVQW